MGPRELSDVVLLVNPAAARSGGRADTAARLLREAGVRVRTCTGTSIADSRRLAARAAASRPDALVVLGGDGMAHLAAQTLVGTGVPLGLVPAGSGDDLARLLGVPRNDPAAAVAVLLRHTTRAVDVIDVDGTYVVTVLAAGFDSLVNERANALAWPRGRLRYHLAMLAELRVFRPLSYRLVLDGETRVLDAMTVAIGNGPSYGGGLRICAEARPADGLLDVVVVQPLTRRQLVWLYPRMFSGTHLAHPAVEVHRVRSVSVEVLDRASTDGRRLVAYGDGEPVTSLPLTARVRPGALHVVCATGS